MPFSIVSEIDIKHPPVLLLLPQSAPASEQLSGQIRKSSPVDVIPLHSHGPPPRDTESRDQAKGRDHPSLFTHRKADADSQESTSFLKGDSTIPRTRAPHPDREPNPVAPPDKVTERRHTRSQRRADLGV